MTEEKQSRFLEAIKAFVHETELRRLSYGDCIIRLAEIIDEHKKDKT